MLGFSSQPTQARHSLVLFILKIIALRRAPAAPGIARILDALLPPEVIRGLINRAGQQPQARFS